MARIKMLRDDKGCRAENPGQVETFREGRVYEVDDELAEAFVEHMGAAAPTDEPVTVDADLAPEVQPLAMNPAPVMDLAAMAAQVADMLKSQFATDIAAIGERLTTLEESLSIESRNISQVLADLGEARTASAAISGWQKAAEGLRADLDQLRSEFDAALDEDAADETPGKSGSGTTSKPKASK